MKRTDVRLRWRPVDRRHELEIRRRSIVMLTPGVNALNREQALDLLRELAEVEARLERLRSGMAAMLAEDEKRAGPGAAT